MTTHKAFIKLGNWKQPKWSNASLLEEYSDGTCLVEVSGQKVIIESNNIKKYEQIKYDWEIKGFKELNKFMDSTWEDLKVALTEAMQEFFPEEKLEIDEEEKIIYSMDKTLGIGGGITEIESISSFKDTPEWFINAYKTIGATRWEPEDFEEIDMGHSGNVLVASKLFVDAMWSIKSSIYWENKSYEKLANNL